MKKYVRAVFDELERKSGRGVAAEQNSAAGACGGRQVAGPLLDELVREDGKGEGLLGVGVDPALGGRPDVKRRKKLA
jgi:hypothetical protein